MWLFSNLTTINIKEHTLLYAYVFLLMRKNKESEELLDTIKEII
jgi:hypothetical protein